MTTTLEPAPPEAPDWEPRRRRVPQIGPAWRAGGANGFGAPGFFIPVWMGLRARDIRTVPTAWEHGRILTGRVPPVLTGNLVAALVLVVVMSALRVLFVRDTRIGIALRASAEN